MRKEAKRIIKAVRQALADADLSAPEKQFVLKEVLDDYTPQEEKRQQKRGNKFRKTLEHFIAAQTGKRRSLIMVSNEDWCRASEAWSGYVSKMREKGLSDEQINSMHSALMTEAVFDKDKIRSAKQILEGLLSPETLAAVAFPGYDVMKVLGGFNAQPKPEPVRPHEVFQHEATERHNRESRKQSEATDPDADFH